MKRNDQTPSFPKPMDGVPRHLRIPGDDGYRTPTIDDVERQVHFFRKEFRVPEEQSTASYLRSLNTATTHSQEQCRSREHKVNDSPQEKQDALHDTAAKSLPLKYRLKHFTWAFFTLTMATGGIANVLYSVPFHFRGLRIIGDIFFLGNMVAYLVIWALIILRFYYYPQTFKASFLHPTESLFVPAAAVSFGTILINISQYGLEHVGPWLNRAVLVLFWFDATLAVVLSVGIYMLLWSTQYFSVSRMTPIWIFPAYPLLIIGPHAGVLASQLSPPDALSIIIGGFTIQGIGFLVSLMVYSAFIYRLMTQKLPRESIRPGMFVSVGPSGFTVAGTVNMASAAKRIIPKVYMDGADGQLVATILKVCADWMCLWLWGLAIWFFLVSCAAHLTVFLPFTTSDEGDTMENGNPGYSNSNGNTSRHLHRPRMIFSMTFFSFVFPNTALVTATFAIGKAFDSKAIKILGCVMTCLLILTWIAVVFGMIRAIRNRVILWPEQGEDRDEGGFKTKRIDQGNGVQGIDGLEGGRGNGHNE